MSTPAGAAEAKPYDAMTRDSCRTEAGRQAYTAVINLVSPHGDDDLPAITDKAADLRKLGRLIELQTGEVVREMRDRGASWADVAAALRMTRQAAHERFSRMVM